MTIAACHSTTPLARLWDDASGKHGSEDAISTAVRPAARWLWTSQKPRAWPGNFTPSRNAQSLCCVWNTISLIWCRTLEPELESTLPCDFGNVAMISRVTPPCNRLQRACCRSFIFRLYPRHTGQCCVSQGQPSADVPSVHHRQVNLTRGRESII
jgi:hypothetical protein